MCMNKKGFTLVELLVVVAILGVLAAVGIVSFGGYLGKSKENVVRANHKQIINYMQAQIIKCSSGVDIVVTNPGGGQNDIGCDETKSVNYYMDIFSKHFREIFENPFHPNANPATGQAWTSDDDWVSINSNCADSGVQKNLGHLSFQIEGLSNFSETVETGTIIVYWKYSIEQGRPDDGCVSGRVFVE